MTALAVIGAIDELWSGVAVVAAPEVEKLHDISHAGYTLWVFAVPILVASLIEAPIALLSDRMPRKLVLASSLGMLAVSLLLAALAPTPWLLAGALALAGAASGVACGTAQAELVTRYPGGAAPAMTRWIAFSAAGDALTPLAIALVYGLGGTHRSVLALLAALLAVQAVCTYWSAGRGVAATSGTAEDQTDTDPESASVPLRAALASAARNPRLWLFLFGAACCALLDEVVVALGALRLHDDLGWSDEHVAFVMTGLSSGAVIGAVASERLLGHFSSRRLLLCAAAGSCVFLGVVICSTSAPVIASALFLLGVTCALHYPLVKAAAYELVPGQPGVVNALQQAFVGMDIALPLAVGAIASRFGLAAALASLSAEPLVLIVVALCWRTSKPNKQVS